MNYELIGRNHHGVIQSHVHLPEAEAEAILTRGLPRREAYLAIDNERDYQGKWDKVASEGHHELAAWILFMEDYLTQAREFISRSAAETVNGNVLAKIRCVTAMGVACMEQHGAPLRNEFRAEATKSIDEIAEELSCRQPNSSS